jgi:hypothetical protein
MACGQAVRGPDLSTAPDASAIAIVDHEAALGEVRGRVLANGTPRAGVHLRLGTAGRTRLSTTDEAGRFVFDRVAAGTYALAANLGSDSLGAFVPVDVGLGLGDEARGDGGVVVPVTELTVELVPTAKLAGVVRDDAGHPLPGAFVRVEELDRPLPVEIETGADGRFVVADRLSGNNYRVSVRRSGYIPDGPRTAVAGGAVLEVRLRRGATLDGSVVDESGRPIAGAELAVVSETGESASAAVTPAPSNDGSAPAPNAGDGWSRLEQSGELGVLRGPIPFPPALPLASAAPGPSATALPRSDSQGKFHLAELAPGKVIVTARHPDFAAGDTVPVVLVGGQARSVRITLRAGALLRGRVVDEDHHGVGDAEVTTSDGRTLITDASGQFTVPHLLSSVQLRARHAGYLRADAKVEIAADQSSAEVELTLHHALGRLGGQVLGARGDAAPGARVTVTPRGGEAVSAVADRDGRFHIDGLPEGPYRVTVDRAGSPRLRIAALEASDDVRLMLEAGGGIEGEIFDERTGAPPRDLRLELVWDDERKTVPLEGRNFRVVGLPTGPVRLVGRAHGYPHVDRMIEVVAGEHDGEITVRDLRIELELGGRVRGRVRDEHGGALAGAEVELVTSGPGLEPVRSDAQGDFVLEGVPAGRAQLRARLHTADGTLVGQEAVEVRGNEDSRVELTLAPLAP